MSHVFVSITNSIADTHTNTCDMYRSRQRHIHDPVITSQDESYTWYIFTRTWLGQSVVEYLKYVNIKHLNCCLHCRSEVRNAGAKVALVKAADEL
jgi:hypothetical protein